MGFTESIKELYGSMKAELVSQLDYCFITPDIEDDKLERDLNVYVANEDPFSVVCIGKASAKNGLLQGFLGSSHFLFTNQTLYIDSKSIIFSEINSISYHEETKAGLFGKTKTVTNLIVTDKSGNKQNFSGNVASPVIAQFLDAVAKRYNDNPPEEIIPKEYPRSKLIVEALHQKQWAQCFYERPNLNDEKLNKLIIRYAKDETKPSFAASYKDKLYFSNDNLYYAAEDGFKRIPYADLSKAVYNEITENKDDDVVTTKKISLFDKNGNIIFEKTGDIARKEIADFFNRIISDNLETPIESDVSESAMKVKEILRQNLNGIKGNCLKTYIAPDIPKQKLYNAANVIANGIPEKDVFAIWDTSPFGHAKGGLVFTENAFYYRDYVSESRIRVEYKDIKVLELFQDSKCLYISIPSISKKMLKFENEDKLSVLGTVLLALANKDGKRAVLREEKKQNETDEVFVGSGTDEKKELFEKLLGRWNDIFKNSDFSGNLVLSELEEKKDLPMKEQIPDLGSCRQSVETVKSDEESPIMHLESEKDKIDFICLEKIKVLQFSTSYSGNISAEVQEKEVPFYYFRYTNAKGTLEFTYKPVLWLDKSVNRNMTRQTSLALSFSSGEQKLSANILWKPETSAVNVELKNYLCLLFKKLDKLDVYDNFMNFKNEINAPVIAKQEEEKRKQEEENRKREEEKKKTEEQNRIRKLQEEEKQRKYLRESQKSHFKAGAKKALAEYEAEAVLDAFGDSDTENAESESQKNEKVAIRYFKKGETEEEPDKAFMSFGIASFLGNLDATVELAKCYLYGLGTERDETAGMELINEAAERGSETAKEILAEQKAKK